MMAESDKKRFDTEVEHIQQFCIHILIHVLQIAAYNTQSQSASTLKGKALKKKVKDPNAPKRSLSAFFFFGNDQRAQIKEENPDFGVTDIAKEIGKRWADIDPNLKAKFEISTVNLYLLINVDTFFWDMFRSVKKKILFILLLG